MSRDPAVVLVAAVAANGVIGCAGRLPWRLPADLARFRRLTWGHRVVVGRRTWESIGRPLEGRTLVVLSRRRDLSPAGVLVAPSLEAALASGPAGEARVFVAGGGEVFRAALPLADRLELTLVRAVVEGDVLFPPFDVAEWWEADRRDHPADPANPLPFSFVRLERRDRAAS